MKPFADHNSDTFYLVNATLPQDLGTRRPRPGLPGASQKITAPWLTAWLHGSSLSSRYVPTRRSIADSMQEINWEAGYLAVGRV